MLRFMYVFLIFMVSSLAHAAPPAPAQKSPDAIAQEFFAALGQNKVQEAVQNVFAGSEITLGKPQDLVIVNQEINSAITLFGQPFANELITTEDISPSLIKRAYLLKHENMATRWEIIFYRPHDRWIVVYLFFDNKLQELFRK